MHKWAGQSPAVTEGFKIMSKPLQNLEERTEDFALRVIRLHRALPKDDVARVIGKQLLRSGTSIGANYREASRARSKAEFIAKVGDSLKEANESEYWIRLLIRAEVLPEEKLTAIRAECGELIAIFIASLNTAKSKPEKDT